MDSNFDGRLILIACETFVERCRRRAANDITSAFALDRAISKELEMLKLEVAKHAPKQQVENGS